jgi:transcriptional regulator with XRE-family HTH domain
MANFAQFFHQKRRATGLSLRKFCLKHGFHAGNISKLEQGILPAPRSQEKLQRYAEALEIPTHSDDWIQFFDLAALSTQRIPSDIASDEEVLQFMPVLFGAIRDTKGHRDKTAEREMLQSLAESLRKELRTEG